MLWYNEYTRALKRTAQKTKLEVFCITWKDGISNYRKPSAYFPTILDENTTHNTINKK